MSSMLLMIIIASGGYQDSYQDISPSNGGSFGGFGQDERRPSDKWEDWTESGWSEDSPAKR